MIEAQYMLYGSILGVIVAYFMERLYREKLIHALCRITEAAESLHADRLLLLAKIKVLEEANSSPPSSSS